MFDFNTLISKDVPFPFFVGKAVSDDLVADINAEWPAADDTRWVHENGKFAKKSAILFPKPLPPLAQALAAHMYSPAVIARLSYLTGILLVPDPWFTEGPDKPMLGGGLHEIHPGGLLKMHVDFNKHPSGLARCLNLLIYLNPVWKPEWNGDINLGWKVWVTPTAGMTVIFETTRDSWHGHPLPLTCPPHITRRSMALYYYTEKADSDRPTTVYRKD